MNELESKINGLKSMLKKKIAEGIQTNSGKESWTMSFIKNMITKVFTNLTVKIKDIKVDIIHRNDNKDLSTTSICLQKIVFKSLETFQ